MKWIVYRMCEGKVKKIQQFSSMEGAQRYIEQINSIRVVRSGTYFIQPEQKIGMCSECKEMTSVDEPCCGAPVEFEGSLE